MRTLSIRQVLFPVSFCLILLSSAVPVASAQNKPSAPAPLTWDDAPQGLVAYHGLNDWLYETGQRTETQAYGPLVSLKKYKVGDTERFYALNYDSGNSTLITATLKAITAHAYWWFENGTTANALALAKAGTRFEQSIYPLDMKAFAGSAPSHGVDADPHIYILHQKTIGAQVVGLFRGQDECPKSICTHSNQHNMIYIGLDNGPVGSAGELDTISHELQHLIRYQAGGQDRWLDEAMAQLAEHLNGFSDDSILGSSRDDFLAAPRVQVNDWPIDPNADPSLNYAVGYLFISYLNDRFGLPVIQAIAQSPYKGLAAISHALTTIHAPETLDQVFTDWTLANFVNDPSLSNGRYFYSALNNSTPPRTASLTTAHHWQGTLPEYSADYLNLTTAGTYRITFAGQSDNPLPALNPPGGSWIWWSYNAPEGISRLERSIDLRNARLPVLTYKAWWNIDSPDYDRAYVLISSDNGVTWKAIRTAGESACPTQKFCYADSSNGWQDDQVDLSAYSGQQIRLRFEYVTESGGGSDGLFLTDFQLSATGFADTVQNGINGWQATGFARVTDRLPQSWEVSAVLTPDSAADQVIAMPVQADDTGSLTITVPSGGATVVVGAMTPFARGTTHYTLTTQLATGTPN